MVRPTRRWTRWVVIAAGVLALGAVVGAFVVRSRDSVTPVAVEEVVDRFRTEGTSVSERPAEVDLPAPGVYTYRTTGGESIDALGGAEHDYPERTAITVSDSDCGVLLRWEPLEERWDEQSLCATQAGMEMPEHRVHHEFFGVTDERAWDCAGYLLLPLDRDVGSRWPILCEAGATVSAGSAEVAGREELEVGGVAVDTVHVRYEAERAGENEGPTVRDDWFDAETGLLVRRESSIESRSESPVGSVRYEEEFTLHLESLVPQA